MREWAGVHDRRSSLLFGGKRTTWPLASPGMAQYGYPAMPPPKPPVSGGDVAVSVTALILTVLLGAVAAFFGLFSLAFLDSCPPATCSVDGAVTAVMTGLGIAAVIGVVGLVATVVAAGPAKAGLAVRGCHACAVHDRGVPRRRRLRDGGRVRIRTARASSKSATRRDLHLPFESVEIHPAPEQAPGLVPVGALRSGDPITDVNGGGQHYIVLESKKLAEGCVVLELESKANDRLG